MKPTHILWRSLFYLVSFLATIAIIILFIVQMQNSREPSVTGYLSFVAIYLGVVWFMIIFHELGHVLAARLVGFRIEMVVVGPVKLTRFDGRFKWGINHQSVTPGFVVATPVGSKNFVARFSLFVLGGPFFSLLLTVASALLFLKCYDLIDASNGIYHKTGLALQLLFVAGFSFLINLNALLLSIIPMLIRGKQPNDAAILLWLGQQKKQSVLRDLQLSSLSFLCHEGMRPNQWKREEMLQILGTKSVGTVNDVHVYLMGYYHFLDSGEIQAAEAVLEKAIESYQEHAKDARPSVLLEAVYFKAFFRNETTQATGYLKLCESNTEVEKPTRLRAEAAFHLAEKRYELCLQQAESALKDLKYSKDRGGSLAEADWINAIITRCHSVMKLTSPPVAASLDTQSSPESR